jgi:tetratricopeptide (TPR) repeat protein
LKIFLIRPLLTGKKVNRNDFIRIIHNTDSLDPQMIGEVRDLLDLFPYFQSAHLLLLKGLHKTSDVKFENQLKQSAIFLADREVLYYLLKQEHQPITEQQEAAKSVILNKSVIPDSQQTVIESGKNSQELINEFEKNSYVTGENKNQEISSKGNQHSILVTEESDEDDSVNIVFLLDDDDEPAEEKIIYMDPSIRLPVFDDLLELDLQEEVSVTSNEDYEASSVPNVVEKLSRKQEQTNLIEKFIIANPRIEPVRDKSYHPVEDISKPYTEEKGGFITETLAKIYVSQGYYSKAIDIYDKLSLKFPEKSSYFATQIEKVKELIK